MARLYHGKTKKQGTVSRFSLEAKYRAMTTVTSELVWIKSFLTAMEIFHTYPMQLFCDKQSALHIAENPIFHEKTKHIEINNHFVRERLFFWLTYYWLYLLQESGCGHLYEGTWKITISVSPGQVGHR